MPSEDMSSKPAVPHPPVAPPPDFAFRIEATLTDVVVIGKLPEGLRIDAHYSGKVVAGPLAGSIVRGIDYLLIRSDGVMVLDVRETITTSGGQQIGVRAQGYGSVSAAPQAGVEAARPRDAQFTWPDAPNPLLGVAICQTTDPEFLWLNQALLVFSGTANLGKRTLQVVGRVLTPEMVLSAPAN